METGTTSFLFFLLQMYFVIYYCLMYSSVISYFNVIFILKVMRCSSNLPIYLMVSNTFKKTLTSWIQKIRTSFSKSVPDGKCHKSCCTIFHSSQGKGERKGEQHLCQQSNQQSSQQQKQPSQSFQPFQQRGWSRDFRERKKGSFHEGWSDITTIQGKQSDQEWQEDIPDSDFIPYNLIFISGC